MRRLLLCRNHLESPLGAEACRCSAVSLTTIAHLGGLVRIHLLSPRRWSSDGKTGRRCGRQQGEYSRRGLLMRQRRKIRRESRSEHGRCSAKTLRQNWCKPAVSRGCSRSRCGCGGLLRHHTLKVCEVRGKRWAGRSSRNHGSEHRVGCNSRRLQLCRHNRCRSGSGKVRVR